MLKHVKLTPYILQPTLHARERTEGDLVHGTYLLLQQFMLLLVILQGHFLPSSHVTSSLLCFLELLAACLAQLFHQVVAYLATVNNALHCGDTCSDRLA